jgi:hypothetical protein
LIAADQPDCFPNDLLTVVSSSNDGTVLDRSIGVHNGSVVSNRTRFCESVGVDYGDTVFQRIIYTPQASYEVLAEVDERSTTKHTPEVVADALFTETPGVGLLLPVADCIATVVYDPILRKLALLHLGRHSTLTGLIAKTIGHFEMRGSPASDLVVWMSPSAGRATYRLDHFDHKDDPAWKPYCDVKEDGVYLDMHGYNRHQLLAAGLVAQNIHTSPINTMTSDDYFSHAMGDERGRMAVLAMMR